MLKMQLSIAFGRRGHDKDHSNYSTCDYCSHAAGIICAGSRGIRADEILFWRLAGEKYG